MKWLLILVILFAGIDAAQPAEESLGTKIKKVFEPSPTPSRKHRKKKTTPTPSPKQKKASPTPSPSPSPKSKSKRKKPSPSPSTATEESPSPTPVETPAPPPSGSRASGKKAWPNVSLSPDEIADYDSYPSKVRQILDAGLALTK